MNIQNRIHAKCLVFICILAVTISACTKDYTPPAKTKSQLISQKSWHWTKSQYKTQDGSLVNQQLDPVQTAATYTFKSDGTLTIAGEANGQTTTGSWQLTTNDTQFVITATNNGESASQTFNCTVSEDTFVLSADGQFTALDPVTAQTVTYYGKVSTFTH